MTGETVSAAELAARMGTTPEGLRQMIDESDARRPVPATPNRATRRAMAKAKRR